MHRDVFEAFYAATLKSDNTTERKRVNQVMKDVAVHHEKCADVWKKYKKNTEHMDDTQWYSQGLFQEAMVNKGHSRVRSVKGKSCGHDGNHWYYDFVSFQ